MFSQFARRSVLATALISVMGLGACSTEQVANTTGDVAGAVGRTTVHVVAGAGRLAARGVRAGVDAVKDD